MVQKTKVVRAGNVRIGGNNPVAVIAGPCVIEGRDITLKTARTVARIAAKHGVGIVFKSSYKKANRTSGKSFTGIGSDEALRILEDLGLPVLTDVHTADEVKAAAQVADILQIPAFLCRQTDLLQAAGCTGKIVNVKKGQFLAPDEMRHAAEKVTMTGNKNVMLTERGSTFGYHNLVVDMRALVIMRKFGFPIVLDATHAVQLPGGESNRSGGQPEFIFPIARAGAAIGIDALFVETHPDPSKAMSDASSQLPLRLFDSLLSQIVPLDAITKER